MQKLLNGLLPLCMNSARNILVKEKKLQSMFSVQIQSTDHKKCTPEEKLVDMDLCG